MMVSHQSSSLLSTGAAHHSPSSQYENDCHRRHHRHHHRSGKINIVGMRAGTVRRWCLRRNTRRNRHGIFLPENVSDAYHHHHRLSVSTFASNESDGSGGSDDTSNDNDAENGVNSNSNIDFRAFRARLVAMEKKGLDSKSIGSEEDDDEEGGGNETLASQARADGFAGFEQDEWIYETPLLEQGSLIISHSQLPAPGSHALSFSLRQQYFHKSIILLIEHNSNFSRGIIINRPTSLVIQGKYSPFGHVFCGGDVEENGLFSGSSRSRAAVSKTHSSSLSESLDSDGKRTIRYEGNTRMTTSETNADVESNSLHSNPFILCLHSLSHSSPEVALKSTKVLASSDSNDSNISSSNNNSKISSGHNGISYCSLEDALHLVESDTVDCTFEDFVVFVGYAGWAPNQLQQEVDRQSWRVASADATTIVNNIIRSNDSESESVTKSANMVEEVNEQVYNRPVVDDKFVLQRGGDGIASWNFLINNISTETDSSSSSCDTGNSDLVSLHPEYSFDDMMLRLWIRNRLSGVQVPQLPKQFIRSKNIRSGLASEQDIDSMHIPVGTLLLSTPFSSFALHRQYMHKAIILVVESTNQYSIGIILNRPLNTMANFILPGSVQGKEDDDDDKQKDNTSLKTAEVQDDSRYLKPQTPEERRVSFGGEMFNNDAVLLLHRRSDCGGRAIGNSSLYQLHNSANTKGKTAENAKKDTSHSYESMRVSDLILTRGFTIW